MTGAEAVALALERAGRKGLAAEAFWSESRELELRVFRGQVEHFERADASGLGLRVVRDGRLGAAYTETLNRRAVEETLAAAVEIAGHVEPRPGSGIEDWPAPPEVAGLECPEIAALPVEKKIAAVLEMESAAFGAAEEIVNVPWAGYGETQLEVLVANTAGLSRGKRLGSAQLYVEALARHGDDRKSHSEHGFARRAAELAPRLLGAAAGRMAGDLLGARQPKSGRRRVLFAPRPFAALLRAFASLFSGQAAEDGRSRLAGRLGERIGAPAVSILDNAALAGSPAGRPFDAEGVPTRRLAVVEEGVFRSFLHTAGTARRAGRRPTGHAVRSYKGPPTVAPSNLFIPAGRGFPDELRAAADLEIVALTGLHSGADPVSGDFSLPVLGFFLKHGRRDAPAHDFTVAGNFLELLAAVEAVGADFEFGSPGLGTAVGCGSALVRSVHVGGKE